MQLGLLGDMAIDITEGTDSSGRARDGEMFAGERTPDLGTAAAKMLEVIKPVAAEATNTMKELEVTAQNLNKITDQNSELNQALGKFKEFGEHLVDLTAPDGSLTNSLTNLETLTNSLTENDNIKVTLQNFRDSSEKLKSTMRDLAPAGRNIAEFSETVKTHPRFKRDLGKSDESTIRYIFAQPNDANRETTIAALAFDIPSARSEEKRGAA